MKKIKPCPFCGSDAYIRMTPKGLYKVICSYPNCGSHYYGFVSKERAIEEWNTRHKAKKGDT